METNNRNKVFHSFMITSQVCFLCMGLFLLYIRAYGTAGSVLLLTAGFPCQGIRGNRIILFLSWTAIGIGVIALVKWFFQK